MGAFNSRRRCVAHTLAKTETDYLRMFDTPRQTRDVKRARLKTYKAEVPTKLVSSRTGKHPRQQSVRRSAKPAVNPITIRLRVAARFRARTRFEEVQSQSRVSSACPARKEPTAGKTRKNRRTTPNRTPPCDLQPCRCELFPWLCSSHQHTPFMSQ